MEHVAYMRNMKCTQHFGWKTWREETTCKT